MRFHEKTELKRIYSAPITHRPHPVNYSVYPILQQYKESRNTRQPRKVISPTFSKTNAYFPFSVQKSNTASSELPQHIQTYTLMRGKPNSYRNTIFIDATRNLSIFLYKIIFIRK